MTPKKKGAGGSLTRSQVVTVRLDPKLKFAAELAARKQRRTISSFIEWAIEQALESVEIIPPDRGNSEVTALDTLFYVWDVEEADRVTKLALYFPQLLNYEEERIWKIICECKHFWHMGRTDPPAADPDVKKSMLYFERVRQQWATLHKIINGDVPIEILDKLPVTPLLKSQESIENNNYNESEKNVDDLGNDFQDDVPF
ncbi:MAG: hypothetical protein OEV64_00730 [Desulfobulbaceae bacterium]|nr:hypothetical protein [Desulfobulbaceae bacterium]